MNEMGALNQWLGCGISQPQMGDVKYGWGLSNIVHGEWLATVEAP